MKNIIQNSLAIIMIIVLTMLFGCKKKEEVPVVTTTTIANITGVTATSGGNITDEGSSTVLGRGVCWSTSATPSIADNKTTDGAGAGNFSSNLTGLNGATIYYVRAYATNAIGTGYGMALSFTTLGQSPLPTIANATNITATSATLNGSVNPNYLPTEVTFEYGISTAYGSSVTATQSPVTGNSNTNVNAGISNLLLATIYHCRIKAVNSLGTTYSNDITFTTNGQVPSASTQAASNLSTSGATLKGTVNANFLSTVITFEYGTTTSYGNTTPATPSPITGNSTTNVSASIAGLSEGTAYHCRVKAVNSLGTTYGNDVTFTTLGQIPTAVTQPATNIQVNSATVNGSVNANYLSTVVTFEYGTTTAYGNIATATQSPLTGSTNTPVSVALTGILEGTTYHFRVKAVNVIGTTYGSDMTFTTLGQVPTATTLTASNTISVSSQLNGTVNANYLPTEVTFEYGISTAYGSTITASQSPVVGNSITNVDATISGLTVKTTYHYRLKAVNSLGTTYGNDLTFTTNYVIGENSNGGIVFYIDGTGLHGLVSAASDQNTDAKWGCESSTVIGTGTIIGTGNQNTINIVTNCTETGIAAKICYDLVLNGYSDWFLPSIDELIQMFRNLKLNGLGNFDSGWYWSSTEGSRGYALVEYFTWETQSAFKKSTDTHFVRVRAVRAF